MKRSISIVLLATILLQSCVTYQKTSITINEAYDRGNVKIKSTDGKNIKYMNIIIEDNIYYGVREWRKVRLDSTSISKIYLEDIEKSKENKSDGIVISVVVPVLIVAGIVVFFVWLINGIENGLK